MICLAVTLVANAGEEDRIARVFRLLQVESRKEPGCLMYIVHRHSEDPRKFLVYEQYKDDAALEAHRNSPHFHSLATGEIYTKVESRHAELYRPL